MNKQRLYEESIGVKVPGQSHQIATVRVSATDSDEDVLRGISKIVGTVFNVTGVRYELVSAEPFKLKRLNGSKKKNLTVDDPPEESLEVFGLPPELSKETKVAGFQVGETWKTKDKRRSTTFKVLEIDGDFALTDDGRRIQRARSCRYTRIQERH
jgi:hypothetical protein